MTAAKVLDIISPLPVCAGESSDAVSAYTQVKHGRCSKVFEVVGSWMPSGLDAYHVLDAPKTWDNRPDDWVPLERKLQGHPSTGFGKRKLAESLVEGSDRLPGWECP